MQEETNQDFIPIWRNYMLTPKEAGLYFNIGEKKMRMLAEEYLGDFAINKGSNYLINRKKFEEFLDQMSSI